MTDDTIYFKGNHYREKPLQYKTEQHFTDNELVESVGGKSSVIWADTESVKNNYFNLLLFGIMVWHILFSSYLQLNKFERKKVKVHP